MSALKSTALLILIYLSAISCSKDENNCVAIPIASSGNCIDSTLIDPNGICTEQWEPVCGCDGVTYSNSCHATNAGITNTPFEFTTSLKTLLVSLALLIILRLSFNQLTVAPA